MKPGELVKLVAEDRSRGAIELARLVVEAFKALAEEGGGVVEAVQLARKFIVARPSMVPIGNVACLIARETAKTSLRESTRLVEEKLLRASMESPKRAADLIRGSSVVATLSYSTTVLDTLAEAKESIGLVYVFESRPLGEGLRLAEALRKRGVDVVTVPDSSYAFVSSNSDVLLLGCDSIFPEGYLLNKIGSLPAALAFKSSSKRIVVVGENIKIAPLRVKEARPGEIEKIEGVPLFERLPLELIDDIITEDGPLKPPDIMRLSSEHREAWEFVKGFKS